MQETSIKEIQKQAWLGWEIDQLGIAQETEVCLDWQMVYAQTRISPRKYKV